MPAIALSMTIAFPKRDELSQASQERGPVLLFLFAELGFQHQVEEFTL
jgi:hypothetical protein